VTERAGVRHLAGRWPAAGPRRAWRSPAWAPGLRARGYQVIESPPGDQPFGHAQAIRVTPDGLLAGAADPRSGDGALAAR